MNAPRLSIVLGALCALGMVGCSSCSKTPGEGSKASAASATARAVPAGCRAEPVAEVAIALDDLVATPTALYAVGKQAGQVLALARSDAGVGATVTTIASSEHGPFAIAVHGGKVVWASADGVVVADESGADRKVLFASADIRALTAGPKGVYFADSNPAKIFVTDLPRSEKAAELVADAEVAQGRSLAASDLSVAWISSDRGASVWAYQFDTGARTQVARDLRKGHDLSLADDGHTLLFHEGEADLLPGAGPRGLSADLAAQTPASRVLLGEYPSGVPYLRRGTCVLGPATFKGVEETTWARLDRGEGGGPIADDGQRWYWVEDMHDGKWRVMSAPIAECCR